jgi:hypothetical protein
MILTLTSLAFEGMMPNLQMWKPQLLVPRRGDDITRRPPNVSLQSPGNCGRRKTQIALQPFRAYDFCRFDSKE